MRAREGGTVEGKGAGSRRANNWRKTRDKTLGEGKEGKRKIKKTKQNN